MDTDLGQQSQDKLITANAFSLAVAAHSIKLEAGDMMDHKLTTLTESKNFTTYPQAPSSTSYGDDWSLFASYTSNGNCESNLGEQYTSNGNCENNLGEQYTSNRNCENNISEQFTSNRNCENNLGEQSTSNRNCENNHGEQPVSVQVHFHSLNSFQEQSSSLPLSLEPMPSVQSPSSQPSVSFTCSQTTVPLTSPQFSLPSSSSQPSTNFKSSQPSVSFAKCDPLVPFIGSQSSVPCTNSQSSVPVTSSQPAPSLTWYKQPSSVPPFPSGPASSTLSPVSGSEQSSAFSLQAEGRIREFAPEAGVPVHVAQRAATVHVCDKVSSTRSDGKADSDCGPGCHADKSSVMTQDVKQSGRLTRQATKASAERVERTTRRLRARQNLKTQPEAEKETRNSPRSEKPVIPTGLFPSAKSQPQELETVSPAPQEPRPRRMTRKPRHTQRVWRPDIQGEPLDRWRHIGQNQGLTSDTEIAVFLMQHYENASSRQPLGFCMNCHAVLTLTCVACQAASQATDSHTASSNTSNTSASLNTSNTSTSFNTSKMSASVSTSKMSTSLSTSGSSVSLSASKMSASLNASNVLANMGNVEVEAKREPLDLPSHEGLHLEPLTDPGKESDGEAAWVLETCMEAGDVDEEEEEEEKPKKLGQRRRRGGVGRSPPEEKPSSPKVKLKLRKYKCSYDGCEAAFAKSSRLKIHTRTHTGEKPYLCKDCGKAFTQKSGLTVHSQKHTGLRPFTCEECNSTFPSSSTLKQHMRRHTGEKPFACKKCGKTFRWSGHLTQHMRMHEGIKPFLCPDCGKSFSASSDLVKHRVTHTKSRPFKCDRCDKAYAFQHRLTAHQRSHTGDRPFLCSECGAAFSRAHNLTVHMRTHSGDKPYWCKDCGAKFSDSGNFCKHKKAKHGENAKNAQASKTNGAALNMNTSDTTAGLEESKLSDYEYLLEISKGEDSGAVDAAVKLPSIAKVVSKAWEGSVADTVRLPSMAKMVGRGKQGRDDRREGSTLGSMTFTSVTSALSSNSSMSLPSSLPADFKNLLPPLSGDQLGGTTLSSHLSPSVAIGSPPDLPVQNRLPVSPGGSSVISLPPHTSSPGPPAPSDSSASSALSQSAPMSEYPAPQHDGVVFPPQYYSTFPYYCQQQQ
ncbi:uncharacterized protein LOC143275615 [Babylonia areolata]|uniref:uncharacterized protein LOC143275615 n=1 Tax=Babylonia areolata TaxID=304850 RepID=UPI003FD25F25